MQSPERLTAKSLQALQDDNAIRELSALSIPPHHADPFDRQIIAQALAENIPIVTADEKFHLYEGIQIIW